MKIHVRCRFSAENKRMYTLTLRVHITFCRLLPRPLVFIVIQLLASVKEIQEGGQVSFDKSQMVQGVTCKQLEKMKEITHNHA